MRDGPLNRSSCGEIILKGRAVKRQRVRRLKTFFPGHTTKSCCVKFCRLIANILHVALQLKVLCGWNLVDRWGRRSHADAQLNKREKKRLHAKAERCFKIWLVNSVSLPDTPPLPSSPTDGALHREADKGELLAPSYFSFCLKQSAAQRCEK